LTVLANRAFPSSLAVAVFIAEISLFKSETSEVFASISCFRVLVSLALVIAPSWTVVVASGWSSSHPSTTSGTCAIAFPFSSATDAAMSIMFIP
ncbi:MAG: hypothetical protein J6Y48_06540, partial [Clostridia bacterium]|nr:hypothetical protein [Clostridia bacterium]